MDNCDWCIDQYCIRLYSSNVVWSGQILCVQEMQGPKFCATDATDCTSPKDLFPSFLATSVYMLTHKLLKTWRNYLALSYLTCMHACTHTCTQTHTHTHTGAENLRALVQSGRVAWSRRCEWFPGSTCCTLDGGGEALTGNLPWGPRCPCHSHLISLEQLLGLNILFLLLLLSSLSLQSKCDIICISTVCYYFAVSSYIFRGYSTM